MGMIGVLGGMGPAATADFLAKLVALTPARRDQEHLPVLVANLPQVPDRSSHIVGSGDDPLPYLLRGIALLNRARAGVIVVPCNTSHHWFAEMQAASAAPLLHIAEACARCAVRHVAGPVMVLATRGTVRSGFHQRALQHAGLASRVPDEETQQQVDLSIDAIKAADLAQGAAAFGRVLARVRASGATAAVLGCTELPIAAQALPSMGLTLIDSTLELARVAVQHGLDAGWNRGHWPKASRPVLLRARPQAARP